MTYSYFLYDSHLQEKTWVLGDSKNNNPTYPPPKRNLDYDDNLGLWWRPYTGIHAVNIPLYVYIA